MYLDSDSLSQLAGATFLYLRCDFGSCFSCTVTPRQCMRKNDDAWRKQSPWRASLLRKLSECWDLIEVTKHLKDSLRLAITCISPSEDPVRRVRGDLLRGSGVA